MGKQFKNSEYSEEATKNNFTNLRSNFGRRKINNQAYKLFLLVSPDQIIKEILIINVGDIQWDLFFMYIALSRLIQFIPLYWYVYVYNIGVCMCISMCERKRETRLILPLSLYLLFYKSIVRSYFFYLQVGILEVVLLFNEDL